MRIFLWIWLSLFRLSLVTQPLVYSSSFLIPLSEESLQDKLWFSFFEWYTSVAGYLTVTYSLQLQCKAYMWFWKASDMQVDMAINRKLHAIQCMCGWVAARVVWSLLCTISKAAHSMCCKHTGTSSDCCIDVGVHRYSLVCVQIGYSFTLTLSVTAFCHGKN